MRCDIIRDWVHRELDGELSSDDALELARHVATCSSCAVWRDDMRELEGLIVEVGQTERPRPMGRPGTLRHGWRLLVAAAAVVIVALALKEGPGSGVAPEESPTHVPIVEAEPVQDFVEVRTDEDHLAITLPSEQEGVHVVWVYPTQRQTGNNMEGSNR